jgi:hypothetical protein
MQSINAINQLRIREHAARGRAINDAAKRLLQRLLGCWQHDLSRPFSQRGRTYRVCVKCGMSRDFNPDNWETHGPSYRLPASMSYYNPSYYHVVSKERKAA